MEITQEEMILMDVSAVSPEDIIKQISLAVSSTGRIVDVDQYIQAVNERELEFSTSFGKLIAIPHAKTQAVKNPFLAFARLKEEIYWDGKPVKYVFQIGVPVESQDNIHLKILASISRKIMNDDFIRRLEEAEDSIAIKKILNEKEDE